MCGAEKHIARERTRETMEVTRGTEENKMGVMPVNRLLLGMSLPMMLSMLVSALYNIVDSIFVARVSENALTAVSLAFPIQALMISVSAGTGVGVNALLSRSLGEKNQERANQIAVNGIFLACMSSVLFMLVGLLFSDLFFLSQTDSEAIMRDGSTYLRICCICSLGAFIQPMADRLLQATGRSVAAMSAQMTGAVTNLILDPIFIFGYFGLPAMGVAGAAIATVIGQCIGAVVAVVLNLKINKELTFNIKKSPVSLGVIREIYQIGVPSIIMQSIGSVMTYGFNRILMSFSSTAAAVFGAYFKLQSFVFMPIFGLNSGMVPIIAYNYGARKRGRMIQAFRLSVLYAVCVMASGLLVFQLMPDKLLALFDASDEMLAIGIPALRTVSCCFIPAGCCIVAGSVFQSLGKAFYSLVISIARQLLVLLPVAYVLSRISGLRAVWFAFPVAEMISVSLSVFFLLRIYREVVQNVEDRP